MIKTLLLLVFLAVLPNSGTAGSRGLNIAFVDATAFNTTREGQRLVELLLIDMKKVYTSVEVGVLFPWDENTAEIKVLQANSLGMNFDRLLNIPTPKKIEGLMDKHTISDGLIAFYYDRANNVARLKLFDRDGTELLLIRLPLEGDSSVMKHSLMKGHRQGAISALGASVRFSP